MASTPTFLDDHVLIVGETKFHCAFPVQTAPEGYLSVIKHRPLVERYLQLCEDVRPAVIVELGIRRGGSTALLAELNQPEKLVAVEINPSEQQPLRDYIEARGLTDIVRPYYDVDQSDRTRLAGILDDELNGRPIDLVIDDASHLYDETVSSFETIFPRLAPGALFVIEDWSHEHRVADTLAEGIAGTSRDEQDELVRRLFAMRDAELAGAPRPPPLVRMPLELVLARASGGDVIRDVAIDEEWIVVRRGAEPIDPARFRLADLVHDWFGLTTERS